MKTPKTILSVCLIAAPAFAMAAPIQETFAGFTPGTADGSGSASATDFTFDWLGGPPNTEIISDNASKLPNTTDDVYIQWTGATFDWWQFNAGTAVTMPAGVLQCSIALRPDSLAAAEGDNQIDLFTIDSTSGSYSPFYGAVVNTDQSDSTLDTLRTANSDLTNVNISPAAFDPSDSNNWLGQWVVLAFRASFTGSSDFEKIWAVYQDGTAELLVDRTGLAASTAQTEVGRMTYGGLTTFGSTQGTADIQVSGDNLTLYPDAYGDDAAFLAEVRSVNGIAAPTSVSDWNLY